MRHFNVSIENGRVVCDTNEMHVKPKYCESFLVKLGEKEAKDYTLNVELQGNGKNMLQVVPKNQKMVELKDDCSMRGEGKFAIELTPKDGAAPVDALDPIIVND